jgi:hypothetical protein
VVSIPLIRCQGTAFFPQQADEKSPSLQRIFSFTLARLSRRVSGRNSLARLFRARWK